MPTINKNQKSKLIASRMSQIRPSGLRKLFDLEHKISKSSSQRILSFGLGNLNIPINPEIIGKLKIALDDPVSHRYSPNAGIFELRQELVNKYKNDYNLDYTTDQVVITSGCLEALLDTFLALISSGDEIIIMDPTFGYYASQIKFLGGKIKQIPLNKDFELDAEDVKEEITPNTKAIVINFPCNPTGSVMTREGIRAVVETAADKGVIIISDEAYEKIIYNDHKHTCAAEIDYDNVIVLSSFSKTYSMTGFRLGYALGPSEIITSILLAHQYNTACANTPAQIAAKIALESPPSIRDPLMKELNERRTATIKAFTSIEGINLNYNPLGTFYIYPNVKGTGMNGTEFSKFLLENCQIIVVPGSEFGKTTDDHVRISYGFLNLPDIKEAGERMESCFQK